MGRISEILNLSVNIWMTKILVLIFQGMSLVFIVTN